LQIGRLIGILLFVGIIMNKRIEMGEDYKLEKVLCIKLKLLGKLRG